MMTRLVLSYALTAIILLSQVGLPLHRHYCKGVLESVSVFFSQGCNDHDEVVDQKACCKKEESKSCNKDASDCCDDKVSILIQDNVVEAAPGFRDMDANDFRPKPGSPAHSAGFKPIPFKEIGPR
mgnify:CR=1 FL=1